ncbi:MAG TPA: GGDEF domain-containing protein [Steroidobacteraceae bacterium]
MPTQPLQVEILRWSNELLGARTLADLADVLGRPPGQPCPGSCGVLVLADPRHELRLLAGGERAAASLRFVDGLAGVAPAYASLHVPWSGAYQAADHGLLFDPAGGCTHVALLPLPRGLALAGVYNIAAVGAPPGVATLAPEWQQHVAWQVLAAAERLFQRARLLRAGVVDPLTGWNSSHYFTARLREQVATCQRRAEPATCVVVDVDGLGLVNERHGVTTGDRALQEIGTRIEAQVRASDAFAHLGDDEFAVILPATSPARAIPLAERVLAALRTAPVLGEPPLQMSVSIGIAGLEPAQLDAGSDRKAVGDQWLAQARAALHEVKRAGGDGHSLSCAGAASTRGR